MKFYNLLIKFRLYIGVVLVAAGAYVHFSSGFWPAFPLYLVGVILVAGHFFFGPLRLIQQHLESGDIEGAEKVIASIWFPRLLYKPIRSVYYTLKGNIAMMKQDYDGAEKMMVAILKAPGCTSAAIFDRQENKQVIIRYAGVLR